MHGQVVEGRNSSHETMYLLPFRIGVSWATSHSVSSLQSLVRRVAITHEIGTENRVRPPSGKLCRVAPYVDIFEEAWPMRSGPSGKRLSTPWAHRSWRSWSRSRRPPTLSWTSSSASCGPWMRTWGLRLVP